MIESFKANCRLYGWKKYILICIVNMVLKPMWIKNEQGELGFKVRGIQFFYYKWPDPIIEFGSNYKVIEKREFGEVIKSRN